MENVHVHLRISETREDEAHLTTNLAQFRDKDGKLSTYGGSNRET